MEDEEERPSANWSEEDLECTKCREPYQMTWPPKRAERTTCLLLEQTNKQPKIKMKINYW